MQRSSEANSAATTFVEELTVRFGPRLVIDSLTATFPMGVTAVVGANGSGKSTLLRCLASLVRPTGGVVSIAGHIGDNATAWASARAQLGYLSQRSSFPGGYTVQESLHYAAWLRSVPKGVRGAVVSRSLATYNLQGHERSPLRTLSGGTKQRAYIAQSTIHQPKLLLLDEPSAGLDIAQRSDLRQAITQAGRESSVLVTTHDVDDVLEVATQVLVLRAGRASFVGTLDELSPGRDRALLEVALRKAIGDRTEG